MEGVTRSAPPGEHDFDALFRAHAAEVFRTMYAFTAGRRGVAEEATAEAFARAIAHAERIRDPLPWIYRTAFRSPRTNSGASGGRRRNLDRPSRSPQGSAS